MMRHSVAARPAASSPSGKSCCQKRQAKLLRASCCANKSAQRENDHSLVKVSGAKTGSCCQPIMEGPLAAVVGKKEGVSEKSICVPTNDSAEPYVGVVAVWPTLHAVWLCIPPPLDAVIVFSRLTI
jgi:hypothetical protein